jgi:hypothetical protein
MTVQQQLATALRTLFDAAKAKDSNVLHVWLNHPCEPVVTPGNMAEAALNRYDAMMLHREKVANRVEARWAAKRKADAAAHETYETYTSAKRTGGKGAK